MYHFVVNPASRSGKGKKLWEEQIEPMLRRSQVNYKAYFSTRAGEVSSIVTDIMNSNPVEVINLIILGGDGTMNEAMQGITDLDRVIVGYIPTGSSNDFARDIGIPSDPAKALDIILSSGKPQVMDLGQVTFSDGESRRFVVSCGIGYDAAVCEEILHSNAKGFFNKIGLGKLTYLAVALRTLFAAEPCPAELFLDNNEAISMGDVLFTACMVHRYEGGGFMFCPDADANDGILNLCCCGDISKATVIKALPAAFKGKHFRYDGITPYAAETIHIKTEHPLWVHTDGEVYRRSDDITLTCLHNAIHVIKP